jgi:sigma-E factor negative regulatory protein RseC
MSQESISHSGKVIAADPRLITVEIVSESACGACHAKGLCGIGEQKVKQVVVPTPVTESYAIGEEVYVDLKASMGHKAVWIAYALPLAVLVAVILVLLQAGAGELVAGLAGIGAVAVYYFCVWLLRDRLRDQYIFTIRKKQ